MKTRILSFVTIAAIVLGLTNNTFAATKDSAAKNSEVSTVLTDVRKINKIEIHGNVELFVSDGSSDRVKVYNRYYAESALVQNQNGTLRISSYSADKLVVWVTANQLNAITAYDNSEVKSFGKLSSIEMDVNLHDNSYAQLDLDGYSANITLNNRAKADLAGTVNQCNLKYSRSTTVNSTDFAAERITKTVDGITKNSNEELVAL
jgi:Putative auto-transporter adhesin, head GIN domain